MAISTTIDVGMLDEGTVLVPERYDPRRRFALPAEFRLSDVVRVVREPVDAHTATPTQLFHVIATGNAHNGIIKVAHPPTKAADIGSVKHRVRPGHVIISRLRPYLRQVAWVDPGLLDVREVQLVCSSEFYVLETLDGLSIAHLVPFLLDTTVQAILAASQEGGHHPRFSGRTLASLAVPSALVEQRGELSAKVERTVGLARRAFQDMNENIAQVHKYFGQESHSGG